MEIPLVSPSALLFPTPQDSLLPQTPKSSGLYVLSKRQGTLKGGHQRVVMRIPGGNTNSFKVCGEQDGVTHVEQ